MDERGPSTSTPDRRWPGRLLALAAWLVAAVCVYGVAAARSNTLDAAGRWVSQKAAMGVILEKACRFTRSPVSLAGDRLNMGAYFAYQEIVLADPLPLEGARYRFLLDTGRVMAFFVDHHEGGSEGFVFRAAPAEAGAWFRADAAGGFLEQQPLPALVVSPGRWHQVELNTEGERLVLTLNGEPVHEASWSGGDRRVGFRNSGGSVWVDDVVLEGSFADSPLVERFHGRSAEGLLLALLLGALAWAASSLLLERGPRVLRGPLAAVLILAAVGALLLWMEALALPWRLGEPMQSDGIQNLAQIIAGLTVGWTVLGVLGAALSVFLARARPAALPAALALALALVAGLAFAEQHLLLSYAYPRDEWDPSAGTYCDPRTTEDLLAAIQERWREPAPAGTERILFIGGSTTLGSGASSEGATWVGQLASALSRPDRGDAGRYQCINAGISAADSRQILAWFEHQWLPLDPRVVVASMSVNDPDPHGFRQSLYHLAAICEREGIALLLSLELEDSQFESRMTSETHAVMRAVAKELDLPLVDATSLVQEDWVSGFVWWDPVHMTDYGNRLYAEAILPQLQALLADPRREPSEAPAALPREP